MTYDELKNITSGLLIGDVALPQDEDVLRGLVKYALTTVATQANSMRLMTLDETRPILRLAGGDYYIRVPDTPEDGVDLVDIDDELVFAVARYIASYISKGKGGIHVNAADRIIKDYNAKVYEITDEYTYKDADTGAIHGY